MECQSSGGTQMRPPPPERRAEMLFQRCGSVVAGLLGVHWEYFVLLPLHIPLALTSEPALPTNHLQVYHLLTPPTPTPTPAKLRF